ncbi:methyltransferase [Kitasatospora sp. NPDC056651]|uniref:methyltransferase n=1 Tax=Kitasatospora sp. NPDC056651 TaxID=3345892 RepID=UPI0036A0FBFF
MTATTEPAADPGPDDRVQREALHLLTGAWRTQALHAMAELRIADHLARSTATARELAERTGTDPGALTRLLRYLTGLGMLRRTEDGRFALTEGGTLLTDGHPDSLRGLALMYGGPCYQAWGSLLYSLRTGQDAFSDVFGARFFAYLAAHPELAGTFQHSMSAGALFFRAVPQRFDFGRARVVADIGGGKGSLLAEVLRAVDFVRGVLFEAPHVIEDARRNLGELGLLERCTLVPGDFFAEVPVTADVYLLSRVLHDWDDDACVSVLQAVARTMPAYGRLLILERLMPEDGEDRLALAWNLHMLVTLPGARERTLPEFRDLLARAGLALETSRELPLDVTLLTAKHAPDA